jgi:hypothetical protein
VEKDVKVQPLILFGGVVYLSVCFFFFSSAHNFLAYDLMLCHCCLYEVVKVSKKKSYVKKITKRRNSLDTSTTMTLGRIFAVPPEGTKRMLEVDEAPTVWVTRKKAKENTAINNEQGSLHNNVESSLHKDMEGTPHRDVEGTPHRDEGSTKRMQLSPTAHNADTFEESNQPVRDEGKFPYCCSFY